MLYITSIFAVTFRFREFLSTSFLSSFCLNFIETLELDFEKCLFNHYVRDTCLWKETKRTEMELLKINNSSVVGKRAETSEDCRINTICTWESFDPVFK